MIKSKGNNNMGMAQNMVSSIKKGKKCSKNHAKYEMIECKNKA
jgi:hypothetical protein